MLLVSEYACLHYTGCSKAFLRYFNSITPVEEDLSGRKIAYPYRDITVDIRSLNMKFDENRERQTMEEKKEKLSPGVMQSENCYSRVNRLSTMKFNWLRDRH